MNDRDTDVAAIEAIITDHERAFNSKDADLLASHFRERSWAVGVNGVEVEGRAALVEVAKKAFAGPLAEGRARYRPGEIEFLGDDVAICHMYATSITDEDEPAGPDPQMIALYVFRRESGTWQVVARQNTLVQVPG
jgi:uncharacterized protein (TIGR02246 family)